MMTCVRQTNHAKHAETRLQINQNIHSIIYNLYKFQPAAISEQLMHCMGIIDMELTAMNISSSYSDNRRPFSHISSSEDATSTGSQRRRKDAKCNSDPRITLRSDHSDRSAGHIFKRAKSIHSSISPFCKRKSYAKSSQNASFFTDGDMAQGMDLLQAIRLKHLGETKDVKAESSGNLETLSILNPQKTKKNIFFYKAESISRPTEVILSHTNIPSSSTDCGVNPVWKGIMDTKDIFKLDFPPCAQVVINHDERCARDRSDSCVTIDSMLV